MNKLVTGILLFSMLNYQISTPFVLSKSFLYSETAVKKSSSSFEYKNNSVQPDEQTIIIQKANTRTGKEEKKQPGEKSIQQLQGQLATLEKEIRLNDAASESTIFGKQLRALSGNLLYGEITKTNEQQIY
ncbi:hypothetical protein BAU15_08750 [Enterococcus sp. JM4C]|uniref:hypothetical protein n=1 Tax=Candidatus Enterococcus huntleyi TaxID=1857217 RepID=UPI00137AFA58|nr:hypothetical protein [Enterococcus sp. JM4C]KAF1296726.1 hypothetical protein BAU15_08750 [Enterococcus sp. JM4C]